jgi:hypothetical protein
LAATSSNLNVRPSGNGTVAGVTDKRIAATCKDVRSIEPISGVVRTVEYWGLAERLGSGFHVIHTSDIR